MIKPISDEALRAIFTKPSPEDKRPFMVRLLTSIRVWVKGKHHNGKTGVAIGVKGGVRF